MEKRLPLFILLVFVVLLGYPMLMDWFFPRPVQKPNLKAPVAAKGAAGAPEKPAGPGPVGELQKPAAGTETEKPANPATKDSPKDKQPDKDDEPAPAGPTEYLTIGSLDPNGGTRMLVTLTNRGAAVARVELNRPRYRDQEDHGGYLGHLVPVDADSGAKVQVVGLGTPAAAAGLRPGDIITAVDQKPVSSASKLAGLIATFAPGSKVEISIERAGKAEKLGATLTRRPLELIRPEWETAPVEVLDAGPHDPLSLLLTLSKVGDKSILADEDEIKGIALSDVNWEIVERAEDHVEMARHLPHHKLTVVKRYSLTKVPKEAVDDNSYKAYNLILDVEVRRDADEPLEVAYRLDGPNGLPTEGWWYLNKISRTWGAAGMRDVAAHFEGRDADLIDCSLIAKGKGEPWQQGPLAYIGVDTQYFSAILIPQKPVGETWHARIEPRLVGHVPKDSNHIKMTNVSCRVTSVPVTVSREQPLKHTYTLFAGPKQRDLLAKYGPPKALDEINLSELIYYGWPIWAWFAKPLSYVLHFFAGLGNYGLAIVMLTVMVRSCMFPLSRKQALNAQKMQELQPEMKKLSEKYKKDLEKRSRALQELYKKHNYSPLSGCLPMFIQMPIFIGLYRALSIDIELRQAPLISEAFGWCTNLAAPDMLWHWEGFMPGFVTNFLGPYLNVLPLVTVALFLWQQKMFMPPPADENAAMQQKIMQYMMIFMAFMFFRVPSGLCCYFIASSLWGIAERKLLPKTIPAAPQTVAAVRT